MMHVTKWVIALGLGACSSAAALAQIPGQSVPHLPSVSVMQSARGMDATMGHETIQVRRILASTGAHRGTCFVIDPTVAPVMLFSGVTTAGVPPDLWA